MEANVVGKVPKMPFFDMIIKSVSEIKRDYSNVIKEVTKENEPAFVMNHNTPEAVLMSYQYYMEAIVGMNAKIEAVMKEFEQLEDAALCVKATERLKSDNKIWLTSEEVLGNSKENEDNPYEGMSDEELFD